MNLAGEIAAILRVLDVQIASNLWNKNAFSELKINKITVAFLSLKTKN